MGLKENKLFMKANSVLGCPLDPMKEVGQRRMLTKLIYVKDNPSADPCERTWGLKAAPSVTDCYPQCKKEHYHRSRSIIIISTHKGCNGTFICVAPSFYRTFHTVQGCTGFPHKHIKWWNRSWFVYIHHQPHESH